LVFKDNEPCVAGINKVSSNREGGILTAPDGSLIAADTLCCIRLKNPRPSKLCICTCIHVTIRASIAAHEFLVLPNTNRKDMAEAMYNRALSGYTISQGPSSKRCRQLEDRLQALQAASAESKVGQDEFTVPEAGKSGAF
jgi:hypothetical protein